jgi:hypothetical protein
MALLMGILEDNPERVEQLSGALRAAGVTAELIDHDNAPDFVTWLQDEPRPIALLSLDHDLTECERLDHGTGMDVVLALCGRTPLFPVIVCASNPDHRKAMAGALSTAGWLAQSADLTAGVEAWANLAKRLLATSRSR